MLPVLNRRRFLQSFWGSVFTLTIPFSSRASSRAYEVVLFDIIESMLKSQEFTLKEQKISEVVQKVLLMISWRPPDVQQEFFDLLSIFDSKIWSILLNFSPRTFHDLTLIERAQRLDSWEKSSLGLKRQGFIALKRLSLVAFWSHPDQWELSGYRGPGGFAS